MRIELQRELEITRLERERYYMMKEDIRPVSHATTEVTKNNKDAEMLKIIGRLQRQIRSMENDTQDVCDLIITKEDELLVQS